MAEEEIGRVSRFYPKPVVAGIDVTAPIRLGDKLRIRGYTTDMELVVESMQIDNNDVQEAKPGDSAGIKVPDRAREGDTVYKVT